MIEKYNFSLLLSIAIHAAIVLAVVIGFSGSNKRESDVGVNIISGADFAKICQKQRQALIKQKKKIHTKSKPDHLSSFIDVSKKHEHQKHDKKEKISDISYVKNVYKIGSINNPAPPYPRIAKLRNYQGKVEICIISDSKGNVVNAEVHKSSGYSSLDRSALKTIKGWQLNIQNQKPSQEKLYKVIVPINFVIN